MKQFFLTVVFYIICSIVFTINMLLASACLWMPFVFNNVVIGLILGLLITFVTVATTAITEAKNDEHGPAFIYLTSLIFDKLIKEN